MKTVLTALLQNITARRIGTLSWGSHIEGAMQIVKARGKKQLQSDVGKLLFISVRAMVVCHHCGSRGGMTTSLY